MSKSVLKQFPKITMSLLPTPLHRLNEISKICSSNIYCKRDDLTGFAFGGNKTRKLDYLIADAKEQKADSIIAIGAHQSNFWRMVAGSAIANGLEVHLILGGGKSDKLTGNLLLDTLFKAKLYHVDSDDAKKWAEIAKSLEIELTEKGKRVYRMPWGGSTPIGTLGYVAAFLEIQDDAARMGLIFNKIIHASSSGGTQAGLVVGQELADWEGQIIGIGVAKNKKELIKDVYSLASETAKILDEKINRNRVIVDMSYMGDIYGSRTKECEAAIRIFAEKEGILLDNVYTGKAAAGLIDYGNRGLFGKDENILFIHTGGNIELFE